MEKDKLTDREKNTLKDFRKKGLLYNKLPEGWRKMNLDSPVRGYYWANNNKSRFSKDKKYKHGLIKK